MYCTAENSIPLSTPQVLKPYFNPDDLKKVETTLNKVSAYLDKAGVTKWWESFIRDANQHTVSQETEDLKGTSM